MRTVDQYGAPYNAEQDISLLNYIYHDGGRSDAGFTNTKGVGDCVARAIAIVSGKPYREVYDRLAEGNANQRVTKHTNKGNARRKTAQFGIYTKRKWFKDYMVELGFRWIPTMSIGSGCKVHLNREELQGRFVVSLSRHYTAVIGDTIFDTYNPDRDGTRCVYGVWLLERDDENWFIS